MPQQSVTENGLGEPLLEPMRLAIRSADSSLLALVTLALAWLALIPDDVTDADRLVCGDFWATLWPAWFVPLVLALGLASGALQRRRPLRMRFPLLLRWGLTILVGAAAVVLPIAHRRSADLCALQHRRLAEAMSTSEGTTTAEAAKARQNLLETARRSLGGDKTTGMTEETAGEIVGRAKETAVSTLRELRRDLEGWQRDGVDPFQQIKEELSRPRDPGQPERAPELEKQLETTVVRQTTTTRTSDVDCFSSALTVVPCIALKAVFGSLFTSRGKDIHETGTTKVRQTIAKIASNPEARPDDGAIELNFESTDSSKLAEQAIEQLEDKGALTQSQARDWKERVKRAEAEQAQAAQDLLACYSRLKKEKESGKLPPEELGVQKVAERLCQVSTGSGRSVATRYSHCLGQLVMEESGVEETPAWFRRASSYWSSPTGRPCLPPPRQEGAP